MNKLKMVSSSLLELSAIVMLIFRSSMVAMAAPPQTVPVTVSIYRLIEIDNPDDGFFESYHGDYYAKVQIDGFASQMSSEVSLDPSFGEGAVEIFPVVFNTFWTFTRDVDVSLGIIPIEIEIWDSDSLSDDDDIDINPVAGVRHLHLSYNLAIGEWSGDVPTNQPFARGEGDSNRSIIFFDISRSNNGDLDGDGIPDGIERFGVFDENGNRTTDMAALGADPCRKTVAIEIDYMVDNSSATPHTHQPLPGAITEVVNAFNAAPVAAVTNCPYTGFPTQPSGVNLVIDVDDALPEQATLTWGAGGEDVRNANFDPARRPYFHYGLFVHDQSPNNSSSGVCCSDSSKDFIVSLGSWVNQVGTARDQSGTIMHELGHALGLGHGGGDTVNYKPNYLSVMNYRFQTFGISDLTAHTNHIDYSRTELPSIDETSLNEAAGIGDGTLQTFWRDLNRNTLSSPGNVPLDWTGNDFNGNGNIRDDTGVTVDINGDAICVDPGQDNVLQSTATGDDIVSGTVILDGADRTCDSTAAGGSDAVRDTQVRPVGDVQVAVLTGHDDWSNIKYRAVLSPDAGYTPPPSHIDIDYPTALQLEQEMNVAINTTDLAITISDSPDPVAAGATLTYTLTVTNLGPNPANQVQVVSILPIGVSQVSNSANCVEAPVGTLTCDLGAIPAGSSQVIMIQVSVDASLVYNAGGPTTIIDSATVANLAGPDLSLDNNSASEATQVIAIADLSVTKSQEKDVVIADISQTYHLMVVNNGPSDAQNVTFSDQTPPNTTFISASQDDGPASTCTTPPVGEAGNFICTMPHLAAGSSASFTMVVSISPVDIDAITNSTSATSTTMDPNLSNNVATVTAKDSIKEWKRVVLMDLIALRGNMTDKQVKKKLDQAIKHLSDSLESSLWATDNVLDSKHGNKVFTDEKNAVLFMTKTNDGGISSALDDYVKRLTAADHALADIALHQAMDVGGPANLINHAIDELAQGDNNTDAGKSTVAINHFRNAWQHSQQALKR